MYNIDLAPSPLVGGPNRIDVLTAIDGLTFADAWPDRQETRYSDQTVPVISRHHLTLNKRAPRSPCKLARL